MSEESRQIIQLIILAIPVAWISWTVTHEEVFREFREYCDQQSQNGQSLLVRKIWYLFTCEYCLSHWVALVLQFVFQFVMVFQDWRGYFVGYAAIVWVSNIYMCLYQRVRVTIRKERATAHFVENNGSRSQSPAGSMR